MLRDVRFAWRLLRKRAGFTGLAILTLALGIGPNSAVFSAFDQIMLRLLPVYKPRELVLFDIEGPPAPGMSMSDNRHTVFSYPQYLEYKKRSTVLSGVLARTFMTALFAEDGAGERVSGELVSGNFFEVLGVKPAFGRLFTEEDDRLEGAHPVLVLSHAFWQDQLGGRRDILGRKVRLNGHPFTIIGVVASDFHGVLSDRRPAVYLTLSMRKLMLPRVYRSSSIPETMIRHLNILARLKPGVSAHQAQQAMGSVFEGILEEESTVLADKIRDRREYLNRSLLLTPALQGINPVRDQLEKPLLSSAALVALVLLIACVNLSGLMMARALARGRELAVRRALGCSRLGIFRQILTESLTLSLAGGAAGLLVAYWSMDLLESWLGNSTPPMQLDGRVLAFNFGLALLAGPLVGLFPALHSNRADILSWLNQQTPGGGQSRGHSFFRKGAVAVQVALSFCLLMAGALFARTLANLNAVDLGFRTENLLVFSVDPGLNGYDLVRGRAFYEQLLHRLQLRPGVKSVAAAQLPLLENAAMSSSLSVENYRARSGERVRTNRNIVSAGFFKTVGLPLLLGREFEERDRAGSPKVAVVNEAFVKKYFGGENPLGRHLSFSSGKEEPSDLKIEIVGVVKNQKSANLREAAKILVYTPYTQLDQLSPLNFYLLSARREASLGPEVRNTVRELDPNLRVYRMETMTAIKKRRMQLERSLARLSGALALMATLLCAVGLYGLVSYGVTRRRREFGVRAASGAQPHDLVTLILREAATYLLAGLAVGAALSAGLAHALQSQLYGLSARDPMSMAAAGLVLTLAVGVAAWIPAFRAARANPAASLRQ
ncbi:MAG: ABC transporter permease [Acidobacteriota bacterium]